MVVEWAALGKPLRDPATGKYKSQWTAKQLQAEVEKYRKRTGVSGLMPCVQAFISSQQAYWKVRNVPLSVWHLYKDIYERNSNLRHQYPLELALAHYPGFLMNQNLEKPEWVQIGPPEESEALKKMLYIYLKGARLGDIDRAADTGRGKLREEVLKMAEGEGIYGYFENDETPKARWKTTNAKSHEELEKIKEYQDYLREQAERETDQDKWMAQTDYGLNSVEIRVPSMTDVFRFGSLSKYFGEDPVAAKKEMLLHILRSPIPKTFQKLTRIAKETDDIEDYMSTGLGASWFGMKALSRWAPGIAAKVGSKAIPVLGWAMLGMDALNAVTAMSAYGSNPMAYKRLIHSAKAMTPKRAKLRLKNARNLKKWKPTFGTMLEALQASEDATGYGLRLGPLMGTMSEMFWGPEKLLTGETDKITVSYAWERPGTAEYKTYKALGAAGELLPLMYHTKPELYFTTVAVMAAALEQGKKKSFHRNWGDVYSEIKDMQLIEQPITNPDTRQALVELGYDPDAKEGYLGIEGAEMPTVEQLGMIYQGNPGADLNAKYLENKDDWKTYVWECALYDIDHICAEALAYPDGSVDYYNTGDLDALIIAAKMNLIAPKDTPQDKIQLFCTMFTDEIIRREAWPPKWWVYNLAIACWGQVDSVCPPVKVYKG